MKRFTAPEVEITKFMFEDILTDVSASEPFEEPGLGPDDMGWA